MYLFLIIDTGIIYYNTKTPISFHLYPVKGSLYSYKCRKKPWKPSFQGCNIAVIS